MKKYKYKFILATFFNLLVVVTFSYSQEYHFSNSVKLNENINSSAEESMPVISSDGQLMFFVRSFYEQNIGGKLSGQDIWISKRDEFNNWGPATNELPVLNNSRNNAVIGINKDGTNLYLISSYKPAITKISGISRSTRIGNEWSKPEEIKIPGLESENSFIGFYINPSEDVLLISMNGDDSYGEEDIYISLKNENGNWSKPENIGATINTNGFEISPFLSEDGNTLFFASDGHDGFGGSDIFMSKKLYDSWLLWSKPINLGSAINSDGFEAYFSLHDDNEAYFVSTRGNEFANIFTSKVSTSTEEKRQAETKEDKFRLTEEEVKEILGVPLSRTIYFDYESHSVAGPSRELIYFLTNKLIDNPEYQIELIGHASKEGAPDFNHELSLRRAEEVAKYFMEYGISPSRINTKGMGERQPVVRDGSEDELSKNRRVEIFFIK